MSGDVDQALGFLAEDVVCDAPAGRIEGLAAYRGFLEGFLPKLTGSSITKVLGDDTSAAVVYTTDTTFARDFRAMDYLTVGDGRITRVVTVFDRLPAAQARPRAEG
ncbi:nuclear transport factor 2 family protein [Nonomuraea sp. SMC257]|uniref:Nuclear transport factor 2 family protein n=2 Tax=Nonomuraea montanisoli TaxID=2741721 RepID=A0A7Y6I7E8_9ACTN|nr:nuclear transport factor 2 family protein [Nonomuraea montanisoli]